MINLQDKTTEDLRIACYMSDRHAVLRPTAFLDIAQNIAVQGADNLKFGDDQLAAFNSTWVLARQSVHFDRPVRNKENVKMLTWHKGTQGLFFLRDYLLLGADGEPSVRSTSSWVVMNITERRLVRFDSLSDVVDTTPQSTDNAIEEQAAKVVLPRGAELTKIGEHRVRYSDVDHNQHANNVKYTSWVLDSLPEELVYEHPLKELTINFNREALPGETVELWHALDTDGAHIIEGRADDHQVFIERLIFQ
ncbi:MAG: hypothetical protein J6W98_05975 [Bacteroidales bacterium]|nr:hypothetical protein [Bacteroidales bacterium]